jgi:hypothetical protein
VKAVARPTKNRATPRAWLEYEKAATITLMRRVVGEFPTNFTEWRFEEISKRLMSRFGVDRSAKSVKNFWNREGRQRSGLDERKKPRPEQMATGVQDPATRRFYRQLNVSMASISYTSLRKEALFSSSIVLKLQYLALLVECVSSEFQCCPCICGPIITF